MHEYEVDNGSVTERLNTPNISFKYEILTLNLFYSSNLAVITIITAPTKAGEL